MKITIRHHVSFSLILVVFFVAFSQESSALPRYALRHAEVNCMGCHVNPTGQGLRSAGGQSFEINKLPMWKTAGKFTSQLTEGIRIGLDYRSQALLFQDKTSTPDSTGGLLTNTRTLKTLQAMALPVYVAAQLTQSTSFYARYDFFTPSAYEAFGQVHFVHNSGEIFLANDAFTDAYLKIGDFMPNFGVRFDDHTAYTRGGDGTLSRFGQDGLFWKPSYKDLGAELGVTLFDHVQITAGYFEGLEYRQGATFDGDTTNRMAMAFRGVYATELVPDMVSIEVGGSYYLHPHSLVSSTGADSTRNLSVAAVHGGLRVGPISILAEADFGKNIPTQVLQTLPKVSALAIEATGDITEGLTALVRFETYKDEDGTGNIGTEVKDRITGGLQWFPIRFVEFRPEIRFAKLSVPTGVVTLREDHSQMTMLLQTHIFF